MKPKVYHELKNTIITLMLGGFSFVAALAWNDAVKALFDTFFPQKSGVAAKFIYAIFVTIAIVVVSRYFLKQREKEERGE
jgi:uncharacterized membrane protein